MQYRNGINEAMDGEISDDAVSDDEMRTPSEVS
jgi:hypothetical protein